MTGGAAKVVLVPIADGSEEIETTCITDTLVRAGAIVVVASVMTAVSVKMARGLKVQACASERALRARARYERVPARR